MKKKMSFCQEIVGLLIILLGILSYGYPLEYLGDAKIEQSNFYRDDHSMSSSGHLITQLVERVRIEPSRGEKITYKDAIFIGTGSHIQIKLRYLLYIRHLVIFGFISILYRMIIYIHNKDGPKGEISPTNRV